MTEGNQNTRLKRATHSESDKKGLQRHRHRRPETEIATDRPTNKEGQREGGTQR